MAFNGENTLAEVKARRAVRELAGLGIDVPPAVQDRLDQLDALVAAAPKHPGDSELVEATLAGDTNAIAAAAIELATHEHRARAQGAAVQRAGHAVLDALRANRKPVVDALTRQAQQAAEKIAAARDLGGTTVEALVIAGRHDDAATLASVGAHRQVLHRITEWAHRHLGEILPVADPDAEATT